MVVTSRKMARPWHCKHLCNDPLASTHPKVLMEMSQRAFPYITQGVDVSGSPSCSHENVTEDIIKMLWVRKSSQIRPVCNDADHSILRTHYTG